MFQSRPGTISIALSTALCAGGITSATPALAVTTAPSHPTCSSQHSAPQMDGYMTLERPIFATEAGYFGTTAVRVDLDASGSLKAASIYKTSGYQILDYAALRSVRAAKFVPETVDCQGIAGSYEWDVSYD